MKIGAHFDLIRTVITDPKPGGLKMGAKIPRNRCLMSVLSARASSFSEFLFCLLYVDICNYIFWTSIPPRLPGRCQFQGPAIEA